MSKQPLKSALKSTIESAALRADQLQMLNRLQQKPDHKDSEIKALKPNKSKERRFNQMKLAWVAIVILAITNLVWLFPAYLSDNNQQIQITNAERIGLVAAEAVRNHLNRKPLEIKNNEEQQVFDYFTELNFRPVKSRYLETLALAPTGGRYCSLQSNRAAFLSYQSILDDQFHTVYQAPYDTDSFPQLPNFDNDEKPIITWSSGVKVTLWTEKGLVFAMTD